MNIHKRFICNFFFLRSGLSESMVGGDDGCKICFARMSILLLERLCIHQCDSIEIYS